MENGGKGRGGREGPRRDEILELIFTFTWEFTPIIESHNKRKRINFFRRKTLLQRSVLAPDRHLYGTPTFAFTIWCIMSPMGGSGPPKCGGGTVQVCLCQKMTLRSIHLREIHRLRFWKKSLGRRGGAGKITETLFWTLTCYFLPRIQEKW